MTDNGLPGSGLVEQSIDKPLQAFIERVIVPALVERWFAERPETPRSQRVPRNSSRHGLESP